MTRPTTIAAILALLIGAATPAPAGFVEHLRESVELSKQQEPRGAPSRAGKAAGAERKAAPDNADRAPGTGTKAGARRERKKKTRGAGKTR